MKSHKVNALEFAAIRHMFGGYIFNRKDSNGHFIRCEKRKVKIIEDNLPVILKEVS